MLIPPVPSPSDSIESASEAHAQLLERIELFAGLGRLALAKLAANLDPLPMEAGEAACLQGEPGDSLYLVSKGTFGVYVSAEEGSHKARVATFGPGSCFGEMALLTNEPRSATVRAETEGELLRLEQSRFLALISSEPSIALAMSATLSRRLHGASNRIMLTEKVLAHTLEQQLNQLDPEARAKVLQASYLERATPDVLETLFGKDHEQVRQQLFQFGLSDELDSSALARMLRQWYEQGAGSDGLSTFATEASERLAEAGQWDEALSLAERAAPRAVYLGLVHRALEAAGRSDERRLRWAASLSDPEALASPRAAGARAMWHEQQGDLEAATVLLRQAAALYAPEAGTFGEQLDRLAAMAAVNSSVGGLRFSARWRNARGRSRLLGSGCAIAFIVAAVVASRGSPQLGFMLLLGAAIALWVTALLPDFIVFVGLVVGWVLLGIAKPAEAVAGFGSTSWISVVAILGLASAISASGLLFRLGLLLVRRMPSGLFGQGATFLLTGILLTPLLPSATARTRLAVPLSVMAAQSQRLKERGPESAFLGLSAWIGSYPLLYLFLNGSTSCFLALGLLPDADRARFDLVHWFIAAAPLGAMVAVGSLPMMWFVLRPGRIEVASQARLNMQLSILGKLTGREIAMSLILIGTVVGFNVAPAFGIPTGLVGPAALLAAVLAGCFNKQSLQSLNWDFILSYGVILSLSQVIVSLGIDKVGANLVRSLLGDTSVNPIVFVLIVAVLAQLLRLVLPDDQALLLLTLALLPTASVVGVDPWIIVITLLASFSPWFFPAQSVGYRVAYEATEERMFSHQQARLVCCGFVAVTFLALTVSVFYWHLIGLL